VGVSSMLLRYLGARGCEDREKDTESEGDEMIFVAQFRTRSFLGTKSGTALVDARDHVEAEQLVERAATRYGLVPGSVEVREMRDKVVMLFKDTGEICP
jgi:hypothetical protein